MTKLSQYAGAYATTTVDKASEIKALLKQRESRIQELEHMLDTEKVKSTEHIRANLERFHKDFEKLKLEHHTELKDKQIQLERTIAKL